MKLRDVLAGRRQRLSGKLASRRDVRSLALRIIAEVVRRARGGGVKLEAVAGIRPDLPRSAFQPRSDTPSSGSPRSCARTGTA